MDEVEGMSEAERGSWGMVRATAWEGVGGNMLCDWARVHRGDMIDGTDNDRVKL